MLGRIDQALLPFLSARRWLVGFSGGVDSSVLLHLLTQIPQHPPIIAVHIEHGLQKVAESWPLHCAIEAQALGVTFETIKVNVEGSSNIEAAARDARYQAFAAFMQADDVLFTAHHQDDQAETFLLRLMRGAGLKGLGAMQIARPFGQGVHVRPLLSIPRSEIEQYAAQKAIRYVDDPTNVLDAYERNFLRLHIIPALLKRWPKASERIRIATQHLQEAQTLLDEVASEDVKSLAMQQWGSPCFVLENAALSAIRQKNALRFWLAQQQVFLTTEQWQLLVETVIQAKGDAQPELNVGGATIRRYAGVLYVTHKLPELIEKTWHSHESFYVPGWGYFEITGVELTLSVKRRQGGERILLRGKHHTVKNLLQEARVPPWLRENIPLFYSQDTLIAVADLWLADHSENIIGQAIKINRYPDVPAGAML